MSSEDRGRYAGLAERMVRAFDDRVRAPLTTINLASAVLESQVRTPHVRRVQSIARAADDMDRMLTDIRDFALSFATGGMRLTPRRCNLRVIVERIVGEARARYASQPIELTSTADAYGEWDADRVAAIVFRLVDNAAVHGHPFGFPIRVTLRALGDHAQLDVWNAGPLLDPDLRARLFEPFFRGESSRGLGLGLFLAREVARLHGGTLEAHSAPIEGNTFRLTLPSR